MIPQTAAPSQGGERAVGAGPRKFAAGSPAPARHEAAQHHHASLLVAAQSLIYLIIIAIFIITFCVQPFRIPSGSMEPTLMIGDFLLVNKQGGDAGELDGLLPTATVRRGEIVVFHYPVNPAIHLVKRVVGLPGDHIRLRGGRVFINGRAVTEPYAMYRPSGPDNFRDNFPRLQNADPNIDSRWWIRMRTLIDNGELIVPSDSYFVLGDNRNESEDSRYWGFVPREAIVGSPLVIYFSLRAGADGEVAPYEQRASVLDALADFARWDRMMRVVR
ncbi:signal peptidase I [Edaphobacter bradus]|uniref:signal peptidase I n=1 Tax=Edaphobacter bradus TaxID=2259016 RepID=UPI0021E0DEC5|nr:signal peptidase I [Edaphobacter bradus]